MKRNLANELKEGIDALGQLRNKTNMNLMDVKREDIVNKLALGWLLRRKAWCSSLYIKAEDPFKLKKDDWAADDWEGYEGIYEVIEKKQQREAEEEIRREKHNEFVKELTKEFDIEASIDALILKEMIEAVAKKKTNKVIL